MGRGAFILFEGLDRSGAGRQSALEVAQRSTAQHTGTIAYRHHSTVAAQRCIVCCL